MTVKASVRQLENAIANEGTPLVSSEKERDTSFLSLKFGITVVEALIIAVCALDAADKHLLSASFKAFEKDLHVTPTQLGTLNLLQSLAMSIALPFWGFAGAYWSMRNLLSFGCLLWGTATCWLAFSTSFYVHCALRFVNGIGLAGVVPVSQAVLVNIIPQDQLGAAFGRLGGTCAIVSMVAQSVAVSVQEDSYRMFSVNLRGWQFTHLLIAMLAFFLSRLVCFMMPDVPPKEQPTLGSQLQAVARILRIPSFVLLVAQGVTGGVPWNAMAFLPLYWSAVGFTNKEAGWLVLAAGIGGVIGNFFSGYLGDAAARRFPHRGRVFVALTSVFFGMPIFASIFWFAGSTHNLFIVAALVFLFYWIATWTPAAANRPICAQLVTSPQERAQIIAWWIMLEGISASFFGAPLVGFLSERLGYRLDTVGDPSGKAAANSLAVAIFGIGIVCWSLCGFAWILMGWTLPSDTLRASRFSEDGKVTNGRTKT